jgi:hypothetical protein
VVLLIKNSKNGWAFVRRLIVIVINANNPKTALKVLNQNQNQNQNLIIDLAVLTASQKNAKSNPTKQKSILTKLKVKVKFSRFFLPKMKH